MGGKTTKTLKTAEITARMSGLCVVFYRRKLFKISLLGSTKLSGRKMKSEIAWPGSVKKVGNSKRPSRPQQNFPRHIFLSRKNTRRPKITKMTRSNFDFCKAQSNKQEILQEILKLMLLRKAQSRSINRHNLQMLLQKKL